VKFRKKPVVVEASQYLPGVLPQGCFAREDGSAYCVTIHGQTTEVASGDWIILESGDPTKAYPCKPDIFYATYESVTEAP